MHPKPPLPEAEGIPLRVAHDREGDVRTDLRLDDKCASAGKSLDLRLAIIRAEVEVDRIGRGTRLLATLKEKARAALVRRTRDVEPRQFVLVDARIAELLQKSLVDLLVGPTEGVCPEPSKLSRFGAGERDVADVTVRQRIGRRLDAEAVAFRVAHDRPLLFEISRSVRFRLDEMPAELEHTR